MFVRGCEKFVIALAYLFCLALVGSCLARFAYFLADNCNLYLPFNTLGDDAPSKWFDERNHSRSFNQDLQILRGCELCQVVIRGEGNFVGC